METYLNLDGVECVIITNEDGTIWSGLKSAYDEQQAAQAEHLNGIVDGKAATE